MSKELKQYTIVPFEIKDVSKVSESDGIVTIRGYAAAFNNVDKANDIIMPGAFKNWIQTNDINVPILLDHNSTISNTAGYNISAKEDTNGLFIEGEINTKTPAGKTAYENINHASKLGKSIGLSIGYITVDREYDGEIRKLLEINVKEYSLTNFPANHLAGITSIKSIIENGDLEEITDRKRIIEQSLREAGCSRSEAAMAVSSIFKKSESLEDIPEVINDEQEIEQPVIDTDEDVVKDDTNTEVIDDEVIDNEEEEIPTVDEVVDEKEDEAEMLKSFLENIQKI